MKRILSLDGGGIRGVFTIAILERIEEILRARHAGDKPGFVLADYFDFIGGTSTGAIIAAMLSKGLSVRAIRESYETLGPIVFRRKPFWQSWRSMYGTETFAAFLREIFAESPGVPMTLGSEKLRTALMLVMRNGSTGSTWPVTNHPEARYNARKHPDRPTNLDLPLWQLVRASAAAPAYFPSEIVKLHDREGREIKHEFIDGGISPYNNPSIAMFHAATLPQYAMNYQTGTDALFLCSIGTGSLRPKYTAGELGRINFLGGALRALRSLMEANILEQDRLCRTLGHCLHGAPIDREFGAMLGEGRGLFTYCRYQHEFTEAEIEACRRETGSTKPFELDNLTGVPALLEIGKRIAAEQVAAEHLV